MKLYEFSAALQAAIEEAVDPDTGEILPDAEEKIAMLVGDRDAKALDVAAAIANFLAEGDAYNEVAKRKKQQRDQCYRKAEWLKEYLSRFVPGMKLRDARVSIGWRNSISVEVTDQDHLPPQFLRVKQEPNKTLIREAIEKGEEVPGAMLTQKQSIVIR